MTICFKKGHNLGCQHDQGSLDKCDTTDYNFGYRDPNGFFRTVLAYDCVNGECDHKYGWGCSRIPRFSNSNMNYTWHGRAHGSATEDNVRQINDVIAEVAGYKTHVTTNGIIHDNCKDSTLSFKTNFRSDKTISRTCSWAANKSTNYRCGLPDVASMCPYTCGTCEPCSDGRARFSLKYNGATRRRNCEWVANKNTAERCAIEGVADACRATCSSC